jgi:hypothetical protein
MAVNDFLEHYIGLTVAETIRNATFLSSTTLQIEGVPTIPESTEEWLVLRLPSIKREPARRGKWRGYVEIEVSCCSREALRRTDKKENQHWYLASLVRAALETAAVLDVKEYGTSAEETAATMSLGEGSMSLLSSKGINTVVVAIPGYIVEAE